MGTFQIEFKFLYFVVFFEQRSLPHCIFSLKVSCFSTVSAQNQKTQILCKMWKVSLNSNNLFRESATRLISRLLMIKRREVEGRNRLGIARHFPFLSFPSLSFFFLFLDFLLLNLNVQY